MKCNLRRITALFVLCFALALQAQQSHTPVVLVSIDAFRYDYVDRYEAPNLRELIREGVRAEAMISAFPTKTFPNHYTIVTGLYPAHNGIVANNMYDPETKESFSMSKREAVQDARWWKGEPIWVTAEKQGCPAAPMFWPGSEAPIGGIRPTHYREFDHKLPNSQRVEQVLQWLDDPRTPCFVSLYFNNVDDAGHHFGPDSPDVAVAVREADTAVGELIAGLKKRGLWGKVNLVVVSDHGMARTPRSQRIALDDFIDLNNVTVMDGSPVLAMSAKDGDQAGLVRKLGEIPHLRAYLAKDLPARWHYSGSVRIAPVVALADEGWTFDTREKFAKYKDPHLGTHGFDNDLDSMRATFIAVGPAFKPGATLPAFENVDVYSLLAHIIGLKPAPNDGRLDVFLPALK